MLLARSASSTVTRKPKNEPARGKPRRYHVGAVLPRNDAGEISLQRAGRDGRRLLRTGARQQSTVQGLADQGYYLVVFMLFCEIHRCLAFCRFDQWIGARVQEQPCGIGVACDDGAV